MTQKGDRVFPIRVNNSAFLITLIYLLDLGKQYEAWNRDIEAVLREADVIKTSLWSLKVRKTQKQ